ncbi:MAG: hypothetical protein HBSAPP04_13030 [Ignavibacteriaceae bacterium]|nr:MAG: hypothetical protein HBSAPP04_13030 [Ignavibacteriaceae bacterium]
MKNTTSSRGKADYRSECFELYVKKGLSLDTIFRILPDGAVSRKTLFNWRDDGKWDEARRAYFNRASSFEDALWGLAENYAKAAEEKPDPQLAYAIGSLMSAIVANQKIAQVKKSEALANEESQVKKPESISPETIEKIQELLGVK